MTVERALAAALLAAVLAAAWVERDSTLAARVREARPWLAWVEAREPGADAAPSLILAIVDPARRRLAVLHVPGELKLDKRKTLERAYQDALKASGDRSEAARAMEDAAQSKLRELLPALPDASARLSLSLPALAPEDEPAMEAARALRANGRRPRAWLALARKTWTGLRAGDRAAADPLLFALELRRTPAADVQPVRLPDEAQAPALLARLLSGPAAADEKPPTVEVLNGTAQPRLASRAVKMLRLRGIDVLTTGASRPRARTLVFDRVGDFQRAARIRAALGCPSAREMTRLDPLRAVDVSVELGEDCAGAFGPESREP